jgi:hypothetical protein
VCVLVLHGGCGGDDRVDVTACGDLEAPSELDSVRFAYRDDQGTELESILLRLVNDESGDLQRLPVTGSLATQESAGFLVVDAVLEGATVVRFERRLGALEDASSAVLHRACMGVLRCPLGLTCVDGECVLAPEIDSAPRCDGSL